MTEYIDSEVMTEFGNSIRFVFPATVGKKDIRDLPLMQSLKGSCASGNGVGSKHQDTIDIKCECVIEFRIEGMEVPLPILHRVECIATVRLETQGGERCTA